MEIGGFSEVIPLEDRVIIRPSQKEEVTTSGIIIPDSGTEGPVRGEVIAVGPGKYTEMGTHIPMNVSVGDDVLYGTKYYGTEVNINGEVVIILPQTNILAIFKKSK
jgi:chaperonin GroES